jgi:hypothetical protein
VTTPTQGPVQDAREWNEIVPDSAKRLLEQHFVQLRHHRRVQTLEAFVPVLGFLVVVAALFVGVWLIDRGHNLAGAVLATLDLVGFFAVVILFLRRASAN